MSITLPYANALWPLHRILVADRWNGGNATWTTLPMQWASPPNFRTNGFEVLSYQRVCLPATAMAKIRYRFGKMNGLLINAPAGVTASYTPTGNSLPDLRGKEIRIQAADPGIAGAAVTTPVWRTVYWGQVEYQEVTGYPAATIPYGDVVYHCSDAFYRTKRWILNRHGAWLQGPNDKAPTTMINSWGHPGYNCVDGLGHLSGNNSQNLYDPTLNNGQVVRNAFDIIPGDGLYSVAYLTWPGAGYLFTDADTINHAVGVVRPLNEPIFKLSGIQGNLGSFSAVTGTPWEVRDGESVWEFVNRVADRRRGRGLVYLDWADDSAAPTGALTPRLTVAPQFAADVTYTNPQMVTGQLGLSTTSAPTKVVIKGATSLGNAVAVDITGDQRVVDSSYVLGDRDQHRIDFLESVSEQIELVATLSRYDASQGAATSLENRWGTAMETAFKALDPTKRVDEAWRAVYQLYGLPRAWNGKVADGNGANGHRADFRCAEDGTLFVPSSSDTSPILVEVLSDLPLLEGYDYSGQVPVRKDGQAESGIPPRRPPLPLVRVSDNRYMMPEWTAKPITIHVSRDGILISSPEDHDQSGSYRTISDTTASNLGAFYDNNQVGCTVSLRLPHRVRLASYGTDPDTGKTVDPAAVRRRMTLRHRGFHLWLVDSCAIWDLDATTNQGSGLNPKRAALGGSTSSPGIIRDDRGALAGLHTIACQWYLTERRTATWQMKCCGLLPSFATSTDGSTSQTYPTIGQMVTTLTSGGAVNTINTPITSVSYDNVAGVTTWQTDWGELDFS